MVRGLRGFRGGLAAASRVGLLLGFWAALRGVLAR